MQISHIIEVILEDTETGLSTLETGLELREDSLSEALDSTPPFQKKKMMQNHAKSKEITGI